MQFVELLIENIVVNIVIICIYVSFLNNEISKLKVIFSIIFVTFFDVLITLFLDNGFLESIIVSIVNIYIISNVKNVSDLIKKYLYYLVIHFLFVGMIFFEVLVFGINSESLIKRLALYVLNGLIVFIFTKFLWKMWISKIKYFSNTYEMLIKDIGKYKMFLDTGNFLNYKEDVPVIIINEKRYVRKFKNKRKLIQNLKVQNYKIKTMSGISEFKGYLIKDIYLRKEGIIKKEIKEALVLFTDEKIQNDMFDGILPLSILIEK